MQLRAAQRRSIYVSLTLAVLLLLAVSIHARAAYRPPGFAAPAQPVAAAPKQPLSALRLSVPADPRLLIIGDSFTQGFDARPLEKGWAYLVADGLGWPHRIVGIPSTGYTVAPDGTSLTLAEIARRTIESGYRPNVVVVQGGLNDFDAKGKALHDAVVGLVDYFRTALPGVQIVLFGPVRGWAPDVKSIDLSVQERDAEWIGRAAYDVQVPYVNPLDLSDRWVTPENNASFVADDETHPNTEGHALLAQRFLADFRRLSGQ